MKGYLRPFQRIVRLYRNINIRDIGSNAFNKGNRTIFLI